jgi:hypothetical protein
MDAVTRCGAEPRMAGSFRWAGQRGESHFVADEVAARWRSRKADSPEGVVLRANKKVAMVEFLVESGAVYSLLGEKDWKHIGLKPKRQISFTLADAFAAPDARDVGLLFDCHRAVW